MSVYANRAGNQILSEDLNGADDRLFIDQRFEGRTLHEGTYLYCTFANVSFLRSRLERIRFTACVFEGCYFRETTLAECAFSASRFIDCEFVKPIIVACDFRNARFRGCYPPFSGLEECLPGEPNLRATLTSNLAVAAESAGDAVEARRYLLESIRANEQHLMAAFHARTEYYRSHFPNSLDRVVALLKFFSSRANGFIWGYGERGLALLRSVLIVVLIVFPALLWIARADISGSVGRQPSVGDIFWLSAASVIGNSAVTGLNVGGVARAMVISEQAIGHSQVMPYLEVWLYGSQARGIADEHSDTDVLVVADDATGAPPPELLAPFRRVAVSRYLWQEIVNMHSYGSLFLDHIRREGVRLHGSADDGRLEGILNTLPKFARARTDLNAFKLASREARLSLANRGWPDLELKIMAAVARHAAILGCYRQGIAIPHHRAASWV